MGTIQLLKAVLIKVRAGLNRIVVLSFQGKRHKLKNMICY